MSVRLWPELALGYVYRAHVGVRTYRPRCRPFTREEIHSTRRTRPMIEFANSRLVDSPLGPPPGDSPRRANGRDAIHFDEATILSRRYRVLLLTRKRKKKDWGKYLKICPTEFSRNRIATRWEKLFKWVEELEGGFQTGSSSFRLALFASS